MTDRPSSTGGAPGPVPVLVYLSGKWRGASKRLEGASLRLGTGNDADVEVPFDSHPSGSGHYATLHWTGSTYELSVEPEREVWLNGEPVRRASLSSGDLLEIGPNGPIVRFRLYPPGSKAYKSVAEVFADCVDCAIHHQPTVLGRSAFLLGELPKGLVTQTSRLFRGGVLIVLASLSLGMVMLARRSQALESRLLSEITRVEGLAELVERSGSQAVTSQDLTDILAQIGQGLTAARDRLAVLEAMSGASARVVAAAAEVTILLQGSYTFTEPKSGRPLRLVLGSGGRPVRSPMGEPALTLEGDGPVLEVFYTGTAFVASPDGLLLTNRHVALPWEFDEAARRLMQRGFKPEHVRFIGYLPGEPEPFDVENVGASDDADVALLRCSGLPEGTPFLPLHTEPPRPGEEVLVLGYPLGIRALIARTDPAFVTRLQEDGVADFWEVARRLAAEGHVAPLASRGIIGQVTGQALVYDAETTSGGSGGPVLSLDGDVVAINAAILPEFGGSNLGVPARRALELLDALVEPSPAEAPPADSVAGTESGNAG